MRGWPIVTALLLMTAPVIAHLPDAYLQTTTIRLEKDCVIIWMQLTPGNEIVQTIFAEIDTNKDGIIEKGEEQAYSERVARDLSLSVDGSALPLKPVSSQFPALEELKEGTGEIWIKFQADLPAGGLSDRALTFENHHESKIAAYQVNCLVPTDPEIRLSSQDRNDDQSMDQVHYTASMLLAQSVPGAEGISVNYWLGLGVLVLAPSLALGWRQGRRAASIDLINKTAQIS